MSGWKVNSCEMYFCRPYTERGWVKGRNKYGRRGRHQTHGWMFALGKRKPHVTSCGEN